MKSIAFIISIGLISCTANKVSQNSEPVTHPVTVKKAHTEDTKPAGYNERFLDKVSQMIPANIDLITYVDMTAARTTMNKLLDLLPKLKNSQQLDSDISEIYRRFYGLDIWSKSTQAILFANIKQKAVGVIVTGKWAKGRLPKTAVSKRDFMLWSHKGFLLIGNKAGIDGMAQVIQDRIPALTSSRWLPIYKKMLAKVNAKEHAVSVSINMVTLKTMMGPVSPMAAMNLEAVALAFGSKNGAEVAIKADEKTLHMLKSITDKGMSMARALLDKQRGEAQESTNANEAVAKTYAYYYGNSLLDSLKLKFGKPWLTIKTGLGMPELLIGSTLSAVAIPAFVKYVRRAKTTEAITNLSKIYQSSANYFSTPRSTSDGTPAPCEFPPSSTVTPNINAQNCCATSYDRDKNDKCDANLSEWQDSPTWTRLLFNPAKSGQHYFAYRYQSSGVGSTAKFTASAYADLDCDGVFSTFERFGYADNSTPGKCTMKGSTAFYKNNETE